MDKDAFCCFDGERGYLTTVDINGAVTSITTTMASPGRAIHIDDGSNFPVMHDRGGRYGPVLKWSSDSSTMGQHFARVRIPTKPAGDSDLKPVAVPT